MRKLEFLTESEINIMRGKSMGDALTKKDIQKLFEHIIMIEDLLEDADGDDYFGTEGWRKHVGISGD